MNVPTKDQALAFLAGRLPVLGISGGKDSDVLGLLFKEWGITHERVFIDTGWEHPDTYAHVRGPLTRVLGPIYEIRAKEQMEALIRRKKTFPSRGRRWCTDELKVKPLAVYLAQRAEDTFRGVVNVVGVRAQESAARSKLPMSEWQDALDCETWRPLLRVTEDDIILMHKKHGLAPNPLYLRGAGRVGCWPCVGETKRGLRVFGEEEWGIERLERLEAEVSELAGAERRWFQAMNERFGLWPIRKAVAWAKGSLGGDQGELFSLPSDSGCMRWGLCERDKP